MNYRTVTFTREDLFKRVWVEPLLKLAAEIGVSDVGLAKACRRAEIPLPGRGYWAKPKEHRSLPPKLPIASSKTNKTISFRVLAEPKPRLRRPKKPSGAPPSIQVPTTLIDPDRLIRKSLKVLRSAKAFDGRIRAGNKVALDVRISPAVLDRAMLLLDTLIKACREAEMTWSVSDKGTFIECDGVKLNVILRERLTKQEVKPAQSVLKHGRHARWEPDYSTLHQRHEWVSTNELTFEITNSVSGSPQRRWADTRTRQLEDRIADIVQGVPIAAQGVKLQLAEWEQQRLKRQEQERLRVERARQAEAICRRRQQLQRLVTQASRADQIRSLCDRILGTKAAGGQKPPEHVIEWIAWARSQADLLDPASPDNEGLLTLAVEIEQSFSGYGYTRPEPTWWSSLSD